MSVEQPVGASFILGFAGIGIITSWLTAAPKLNDLRESESGNQEITRELLDADILIGGVALILGISFTIMTHDLSALIVMLLTFGYMSAWYHLTLHGKG